MRENFTRGVQFAHFPLCFEAEIKVASPLLNPCQKRVDSLDGFTRVRELSAETKTYRVKAYEEIQ
jgi:hypothetical protein